MIRRNPTLIPMTDSDVQDIREMVLERKSDENKQQSLLNTMAKLTQTPGISKDDRDVQDVVQGLFNRMEMEKSKGLHASGGTAQ